MKNLVKISIVALVLAVNLISNAQAQTNHDSRLRFSVAPEVGLPVGSLSNRYGWSLGGSVQAELPVYRNHMFLTANTGFYNLFNKSNGYTIGDRRYRNDLQVLPVKLGVKYFPVANFYIHGEAGTSFLLNGSKGGYDKTAAFTYAPQVGYRFNLEGSQFMDVGVKWEGNTKFGQQGSSNNTLALRVAYGF